MDVLHQRARTHHRRHSHGGTGCGSTHSPFFASRAFGEPCRGRTYGPLIKSPAERLTQNTQHDLSPSNNEDEA
jgi:hypothetical protein